MIHYVVVVGAPPAVARLQGALSGALGRSRYFDGDVLEAVGTSVMWAAAAISVPDPLTEQRMYWSADSLTLINGPALSAKVDQKDLARELLPRYRAAGSKGVADALGGSYNFLGICPQRGLSAFADFSGQYPAYLHEAPDFAVFSNRSTTVREVAGLAGWDLRALSWLCGPNLRGDRMPARGARYLHPGTEARVDLGQSAVSFRPSPVWVWPGPEGPRRDDLTSDEWDEVTAALTANFVALKSIPRRLNLRLSGGKDSRLCLALAGAAGLGDQMRALTEGSEEGPEVECARAVAAIVGIEHVVTRSLVGPSTGGGSPRSALEHAVFWERLRQHSYRYEAIVSPWDGANPRLTATSVNMTGFGGELYKRGNSRRLASVEFADVSDVRAKLIEGADPLGLRQESVVDHQAAVLDDWVASSANHVDVDAMPEKWYVDYRLGHWNGPLAQGKAGLISLAPLVSEVAARNLLKLRPRGRAEHRLHFEVIKRVAPDMLAIPFLGDTWAPALQEVSLVELPREPFVTKRPATPRALAPSQFSFVVEQQAELRALFDDAYSDTDMPLIFDFDVLREALAHPDQLDLPSTRQLLSCTGVAITLLDRAETVVDHIGPGWREHGMLQS